MHLAIRVHSLMVDPWIPVTSVLAIVTTININGLTTNMCVTHMSRLALINRQDCWKYKAVFGPLRMLVLRGRLNGGQVQQQGTAADAVRLTRDTCWTITVLLSITDTID
jgi:hypothetical protein